MNTENALTQLFQRVGISVGPEQSHDLIVRDRRFYSKVLSSGSLGFGESYMDGWWDSRKIHELVTRIFLYQGNKTGTTALGNLLGKFLTRLLNFQTLTRAKDVCVRHYDLDDVLFQEMLGPSMVYTCAYWREAQTLDAAQIAKMDLVCKKIGLKPGMHLLDIGCGFGAFMKYAAENYGAICTGYSLSEAQTNFGKRFCQGLPINFVLEDYRKIEGKFDRIVSIGMFEAVGHKNFREYMKVTHRALVDDGIFLLHTIGHNVSTTKGDRWINRYIFPNGMLPSIAQIGASIEGLFVMEDWQNFGPDYARTLLEWNKRFQESWPKLSRHYDEKFKRMWEFYLLSCAGGFEARAWQLWQIVMTKPGTKQPDCRVS